jgi:membrane-associated protease RseP (regulator of RpoE activity)
MRKFITAVALTAFAGSVYAAPADILAANKAAMGGSAWDNKQSVVVHYAYSGQGLTGTVSSRDDLRFGYWADDAVLGPATQANGFDGEHAWAKDASGTVTLQDGGEQRLLAVNDGYRRANLWWRADQGGAQIVDDGEKKDSGATYDVLTVTPKDGKNFDAWFDAKTHLLARVVEKQGTDVFTTSLSDYTVLSGVEVARRAFVSTGETKYDQTLTLTDASFGPALPQSAYGPPKVTVADFSIAGGAKETTFPFHLINNHIYADVSVDGKGPYQFIFDTGGVNFVTPTLAASLGLKSEGQLQGGGAGAAHMDFGLTKVSSLQLGGAEVKNQVFVVAPLEPMAKIEGVGMPGMVGYETFRRFVTRIDYGKGTVTLIMPGAFDAKDAGTPIPINFNGNTIEATALYDGVSGNFTIDTGSRASLTLNSPFVAAHHLNKGDKTLDAVTGWGVGGPTRSIAMRGDRLALGPMTINGPVVELSTDTKGGFAETALAGNIGAGILKRFVVTLDYEHRIMYLKPTAGHVADLDTFDRAGLWLNLGDNGDFSVVDVTKNAPADQAGLKTGDEITAIDGKPTASLKLYDVRQMLRNEAPGTTVTFAVKRGGDTKNVSVTLRDLI